MIVLHIKFTFRSLKKLQDLGYTLTPLALGYLEFKYSNHRATYISISTSKKVLRVNPIAYTPVPSHTIGLNRASELLTLFNLGFSLEDAYNTVRGNL